MHIFPCVPRSNATSSFVPQNIYHFWHFITNLQHALKGFYKPAILTVLANFMVLKSQKWTPGLAEPPLTTMQIHLCYLAKLGYFFILHPPHTPDHAPSEFQPLHNLKTVLKWEDVDWANSMKSSLSMWLIVSCHLTSNAALMRGENFWKAILSPMGSTLNEASMENELWWYFGFLTQSWKFWIRPCIYHILK